MTETVTKTSRLGRIGSMAFAVGARRRPTGLFGLGVKFYAALVALATVYAATWSSFDYLALTIIFLSLTLVLIFLLVGVSPDSHPEKPAILDYGLAIASLACGGYFIVNIPTIANHISLLNDLSPDQFWFAVALTLLALEATRRTVGLGLTIIAVIFIAYNLFGDAFEGQLSHGPISLSHFLDINIFTSDGLFGVPLRVAATYAFLFVMFGTFLEKAKGGDFFFNLAASISGRSPGGPAKIAVTSSALFGTISGSPTSDVVTTGSITIPMMKRLGYSDSLAGGVEVAASTGGSLLPPIMGSAAFIMAEYTGIPYSEIIIASLVPALLFYLGVYLQVHLRSVRLGLAPLTSDVIPKFWPTLIGGWIYILPLVAMVAGLVYGFSPTFVALFGTTGIIVASWARPDTRITPVKLFEGLADTTIRMIGVIGACAAAGLVIGGITMTGLAAKFSYFVFLLADDGVLLALIMGAVMTIILGLGMPTPSAYVLAAVLIGPALVNDLKLNVMAAHLFLLYYAVLSAMTPPVAVAAYAAAAIAGGNPLKIAATAVSFSVVAFVLPFGFIYNHGLLLMGDVGSVILAIVLMIICVVFLSVASEGFWKNRLPAWLRIFLFAAALSLLAPFGWWTAIGVASGLLLIGGGGLLHRAVAR